MTADPHQEAWRAWSSGERTRLLALPRTDLLLAVQTGALDNLTQADANAVLATLADVKSALPTVQRDGEKVKTVRPAGRQPQPLTCNGLPIGPKITVPMVLKRQAGILATASALLLWALVLALGNHWLLQHSAIW